MVSAANADETANTVSAAAIAAAGVRVFMMISLVETRFRRLSIVIDARSATDRIDHRRRSVQPRSVGGSGSGATMRPARTTVTGQNPVAPTTMSDAGSGAGSLIAKATMHPVIIMQPGFMLLLSFDSQSGHGTAASHSAMPDIAALWSCIIALHAGDADATPFPERPRSAPRNKRWRTSFSIRHGCGMTWRKSIRSRGVERYINTPPRRPWSIFVPKCPSSGRFPHAAT